VATLLEVVTQAQSELGLTQSTSVANSQNITDQQWYQLVNRAGDMMQKEADWTYLQTLCNITVATPLTTTGDLTSGSAVITNIPDTSTLSASVFVVSGDALLSYSRIVSVDSATQVTVDMPATDTAVGATLVFSKDTYPFPTDFSRWINGTYWDRTNRWQLIGPDTPQQGQFNESGIVATTPRRHFQQIGQLPSALRLWPPPGATETTFTSSFLYVTANWAATTGGTGISAMTADDDVFIVDPQAIILTIKWRWLQAKQLAYAAQQAEAIDYIRTLTARDGGAKILNLSPIFSPFLIGSYNCQDGNFPAGS
jgi:hypothetical protein